VSVIFLMARLASNAPHTSSGIALYEIMRTPVRIDALQGVVTK
jgi:hypothetical protein